VPEVPSLSQVLALLEDRAHPATAEDWDRVGLVTGDPAQPVARVRFAVDATPDVVADTLAAHADLLVTHHPLLLRGVSSVAETSSRGRTLAALIRSGCALFTMHTNADQALGGVNDALADVCGMAPEGRSPIRALTGPDQVRVVAHVPTEHADRLIDAMAAAGAGTIGDYRSCAFWAEGTGQFRPVGTAQPTIGEVGEVSRVAELRVEMVALAGSVPAVLEAARRAHPYEEPAVSVVPLLPAPLAAGLGRVGVVAPTTLSQLAGQVARALPGSVGVRVAGDPTRPVTRIAVCSGAGDSLLADVAALDVDAYVTSDLRHHPALDFVTDSDTALVDIPHAGGESLWLTAWAQQLVADASARGWSLTADATSLNTDPWTFHIATTPPEDKS